MLTVNMNRPLSPMKPTLIAEGPDIDKFDIQKPQVPPVPPPRNWQKEQIYFSEPRAEYNIYGNFGINGFMRRSHGQCMHRMKVNTSIMDCVNRNRRHF